MHQFSCDDWRLKLISFLDNFRCIRSPIIYGDQALFVRQALFEQLEGFSNLPILDDVAFCEQPIAVTSPLLLSPPVVTDARQVFKWASGEAFLACCSSFSMSSSVCRCCFAHFPKVFDSLAEGLGYSSVQHWRWHIESRRRSLFVPILE